MKLILGGCISMIVRAVHASETTHGTVLFCHECAILSWDAWEVLMPFCLFPLSLARHKFL